jgi:hypothetical protein
VKSLSFPVGAGLKLNISGRCALYLSSLVHFTLTDNLDNITTSGTGQRQGDSKNDKFIYTSAAFGYDLSAPRETPKRRNTTTKTIRILTSIPWPMRTATRTVCPIWMMKARTRLRMSRSM